MKSGTSTATAGSICEFRYSTVMIKFYWLLNFLSSCRGIFVNTQLIHDLTQLSFRYLVTVQFVLVRDLKWYNNILLLLMDVIPRVGFSMVMSVCPLFRSDIF